MGQSSSNPPLLRNGLRDTLAKALLAPLLLGGVEPQTAPEKRHLARVLTPQHMLPTLATRPDQVVGPPSRASTCEIAQHQGPLKPGETHFPCAAQRHTVPVLGQDLDDGDVVVVRLVRRQRAQHVLPARHTDPLQRLRAGRALGHLDLHDRRGSTSHAQTGTPKLRPRPQGLSGADIQAFRDVRVDFHPIVKRFAPLGHSDRSSLKTMASETATRP